MPHVVFMPLTGLHVADPELLSLGMSLPGLGPRAEAIRELPALGLLTLAGMTPESWSCSYHSAVGADENFVDRVHAERPDLIAISALSASIDQAYRLSAAFRRRGLLTVIGGLHVTACPDEAAEHVDAVVVGEGEPVWHRILQDARVGKLAGRYQADRAFDLAIAPVPRLDLVSGSEWPRMTLQTERGCPLACDFCGASRLLGGFREKPIERIAAELSALTRFAPRCRLELADDNTFAGPRDPAPLFDVFGNAGVLYFTEVDWRIGERPEVLRGMAASGCVQVLVGVESLVFRYPGMGAKADELSRILDAVHAIQGAGVAVNGCLIVGADGETESSLEQLGDFLLSSPFADIQLTLQTPFPGTALYRRLARQGRLLPERGWSAYTLFDVAFQPTPLTVGQLEESFRCLIQRVFAPEPSAKRARLRHEIWRRRRSLDRDPDE